MNADYTAIKKFCNRHRAGYIAAQALNGLLLWGGILMAVGTVCTVGFAFFPWTALPVLFDIAVVVAVCAGPVVILRRIFFRSPTTNGIAVMLEQNLKKKHQYLSIALELGKEQSVGLSALVAQVCAVARESCALYPKRIAGVFLWKRAVFFGVALIAFTAATWLSSPRMLAWWDIPLALFSKVSATVYPGTVTVPRYAPVLLNCVPAEAVYPSAQVTVLNLSPTAPRRTRHLLRPDMSGSFSYLLDSLTESCLYTFTLGKETFGPETVTVVQPPVLYSLKVTLNPPKYTGRKPVALPEGQGSIAAYAGSRAQFTVASRYPLRAATYIPERGDTVQCAVDSGIAHAEIRLWRSGKYTFTLEDSLSQKSDSLPSFYISILPDYVPNVRIVKPRVNKLLTPAQQETLWVEAVDDFGIRELTLQWRVSHDETDTVYARNILGGKWNRKLVRMQLAWDLTDLSLYPGDTVLYWVRTRDNKPYGTPQIGVSDTFYFRLPTFAEIHKRIAGREDDAEQALSSVQKMQEKMKERLENLIKSTKGKESLSWEEKKIVEDLGKNIQEQADSLTNAVKALREAVEKMRESGVSEEILDKMSEVQKTLKELVEEYGDSLLFNAPKPDEKIGWHDLQKAVERMTDMLPDLKDRLDNALKYLEMLRKENERALLAQQAKKLAEQQMQIAQSKAAEDQRLAMQRDLTKSTGEFLEELKEKLSGDSPVDLQDVPSQQQVAQQQKAMQQQLSDQHMPMMSAMNQMSAGLQSLSQELESTLSHTMAAKAMKDSETLLAMAQDGLNLSRWQDGLAQSMKGNVNKKLSAAEQQALKEALKGSMRKLDSLEVVPPALLRKIQGDADKAMDAINRALSSIDSRRPGAGMQQAVNGLNALTQTLLSSANSMQPSGSGQGGAGGMMGGLRKLSAKQAAINSATAELLRQMFSQSMQEGSSGSQMGRNTDAARKAAENAQRQLADQLKELGEKYGDGTGEGMKKRVNELEKEARRIAKMLENPQPQIADRQDRFLVRMLQQTLSIHKQEEGKEERKSKSAVTVFTDQTGDAFRGTIDQTDTFYRLRMKALDGNFPDTYRRNVQKYFDMLGELFLKEK